MRRTRTKIAFVVFVWTAIASMVFVSVSGAFMFRKVIYAKEEVKSVRKFVK